MEQKCPQCNQKIPESATRCNICGYNLNQQKDLPENNTVSDLIRQMIKSVIGMAVISLVVMGAFFLVIGGGMYYLFANVVPNFTVEDAENIFSKFQVFVAVFTFALPIIIIIIFVSVFVTSFRRTLNTSFGVKNDLLFD